MKTIGVDIRPCLRIVSPYIHTTRKIFIYLFTYLQTFRGTRSAQNTRFVIGLTGLQTSPIKPLYLPKRYVYCQAHHLQLDLWMSTCAEPYMYLLESLAGWHKSHSVHPLTFFSGLECRALPVTWRPRVVALFAPCFIRPVQHIRRKVLWKAQFMENAILQFNSMQLKNFITSQYVARLFVSVDGDYTANFSLRIRNQ